LRNGTLEEKSVTKRDASSHSAYC